MAKQRRFFVLEETVPASEIPSMMCRVVANKLLPQHRFAPFPPVGGSSPGGAIASIGPEISYYNTNTIIPDICPQPQVSVDSRELFRRFEGTDFPAALGQFLGLNLKAKAETTLELEAPLLKRYTLPNPEIYFERLMQNEKYAADVRAVLKGTKTGKAYLVTGFMTATRAVWRASSDTSRIMGLSASAPMGAFTQTAAVGGGGGARCLGDAVVSSTPPTPMPATAERGTDANRVCLGPCIFTRSQAERERHVIEEEIFAIAYSEVRLSRVIDLQASRFTKVVPVVGPPKRSRVKHLALTCGDSDEEIDFSSEEEEGGLACASRIVVQRGRGWEISLNGALTAAGTEPSFAT